MMMRDAFDDGNDRMFLKHYTMDDIDIPTLEQYRITSAAVILSMCSINLTTRSSCGSWAVILRIARKVWKG